MLSKKNKYIKKASTLMSYFTKDPVYQAHLQDREDVYNSIKIRDKEIAHLKARNSALEAENARLRSRLGES